MFGFNLRVAKMVWTAFLIAFLLFLTYKVSSTLIVVVFAIFFSYLVYPLIGLLERHGRSACRARPISVSSSWW